MLSRVKWRWVLVIGLVAVGLLGAGSVARLGTEQLTAPTPTYCGSVVHPAEELQDDCGHAMNRQVASLLVVFFGSQIALLTAGLIAATLRRPDARPWMRRWVPPAYALAVFFSWLFLLPGEAVGFQGSPGEHDSEARLLFFLGTVAMPALVTGCVLASGRRSSSREITAPTPEVPPSVPVT